MATTEIPHRIIQTWKTHTVPEKYQKYQQSWLRLHPKWEYELTDDADNRAFIAEHRPQSLDVYDRLPEVAKSICQVDYYRYLKLGKRGGGYADLDAEAIKPLDDLCHIPGAKVVLGSPLNTERFVECAIMLSVPEHPLWNAVLDEIDESVRNPTKLNRFYKRVNGSLHVLSLTGPMLLGRVIRRAKKANLSWYKDIYFLPKDAFYAGFWFTDDVKNGGYESVTPNTYAIHRMANTWVESPFEKGFGDMGRTVYGKVLIYLTIVIIIGLVLNSVYRITRKVKRVFLPEVVL